MTSTVSPADRKASWHDTLFSYHQTMSTSHFCGLPGLYQDRSRSSEG
jgi:hypothetical protein